MRLHCFIITFSILLLSCENETSKISFPAEIVGYDRNCQTCILYFPDTTGLNAFLPEASSSFFNTVNLGQSEFQIGDKLKLDIRKAEDNEIPACITLYPSYNYPYLFIEDYQCVSIADTVLSIALYNGDSISTLGQTNLYFDSLLSDSRCPLGAMCVWAGNAEVALSLKSFNGSHFPFTLNTHPNFRRDTIVGSFFIQLDSLTPYPDISKQIQPEEYKIYLSLSTIPEE